MDVIVRSRKWSWRLAAAVAFLMLAGWVALDLSLPVHGNLRQFDSHAVARRETAMWRSYYDHHRVRLFHELAGLLRTEDHLPFWRSYVGAYHGARAAVVSDLPAFGSKHFSIPFDATGKSWVRFAVWDSAGNPGFVNAVWLNESRTSTRDQQAK